MMRQLYSYIAFARIAFRDHIRSRMKFALRFCSYLFFAFVFVELWSLIAREGIITLPYEKVDILWYVSLTQMLLFLSPRLFLTIEDDVRSGNIAYFLGRPLPYLWARFSEGLGAMSAHVVVYYTVGVAVLYLYIGQWPSIPFALPAALALLYCGSVLHLLFQMSSGLMAFWLHDADAIYRIYQKGLILLGGLYLPLTMYPEAMRTIAELTPFPAMMYLPCSLLLEWDAGVVAELVPVIVFWMLFAVVLMQGVFYFCMKRIEINGG